MKENTSNQKFKIKLNPVVTKSKITTDNAYRFYITRKQFVSLAFIFLCTEEPNQTLKDQVKHNEMYQHIAFDIYKNILHHKLHQNVKVKLIIQPNLFWLVAIPSAFVSDKNIPEQFGIVSITYFRAKGNFDNFV